MDQLPIGYSASVRTTTEVRVYGIRHHGPGSSRSLTSALESFCPDVVLVEGPADAQDLLSLAASEEMKPPIALLVYRADDPARAVFYPFAVFSPEWRAIQYALSRGIEVRFMDLPAAHSFATDAKEEDESAVSGEVDDPIGQLARAAGYEDRELWWEHVIEQRRDPAFVFEAVLEAMQALRGDSPPTSQREAQREAHMRRAIRSAKKQFARVAVVCGAWHAPALVQETRAASDDALLRGMKKTKTIATWIPWTHGRLSYRSGYGAGVESPGWYAHLWEYAHDAAVRWCSRIAHLLRSEGLDVSSADVIAAVRLAEALAALRDHPAAGLRELREAAQTVMCGGDPAPLSLIHERLEVGTELGAVPADAPMVPLARDLAAQQKTLRLNPTAEQRTLELDLRKDHDRAKSRLLHRLATLGIPWGEVAEDERATLGTFREMWTLQWDPELAVQLVEASVYGTTIVTAAEAKAAQEARKATSLAVLSRLLDGALLAELPEAIAAVLGRLQERAARSGDVPALMDAFPTLARAVRYGSVRQAPTEPVLRVATGLFERIIIGLPAACSLLDDESATRMRRRILEMNDGIRLVDQPGQHEEWREVLGTLSQREGVHGMVRGTALRWLVEEGYVAEAELTVAARNALSTGTDAAHASSWLEGLLTGAGLLLLHSPGLWAALDAWVMSLSEELFDERLPLIRRAFASFGTAERRAMAERAREKQPGAREIAATDDVCLERAQRVLPVLSEILGVRIDEP